MLWLANSYRTRDVPAEVLHSNTPVTVMQNALCLGFVRAPVHGNPALVFLCGSGVSAEAYAPMLRPIADSGYTVFIVKLPYRFAPLELHKREAVQRAQAIVASYPEIGRWVVAGHSLGGALACRLAQAEPQWFAGLVLIGTTHPKTEDLSRLPFPVTKVYGSNDRVAPPERVLAGRGRLPGATRWIEIKGGNHSQFGCYGHQLLDGEATISREAQQAATRAALLEALSLATH